MPDSQPVRRIHCHHAWVRCPLVTSIAHESHGYLHLSAVTLESVMVSFDYRLESPQEACLNEALFTVGWFWSLCFALRREWKENARTENSLAVLVTRVWECYKAQEQRLSLQGAEVGRHGSGINPGEPPKKIE